MPEFAAAVAALQAAGCVFAEKEAELLLEAAPTSAELGVLLDQRVSGMPLEYVLGWAEFRGLRILVSRGVFVPRRRTELLVREGAAIAGALHRPTAVDLCCGSGAVGAALVAAAPGVDLHACDIDPAAVFCARQNLGVAGTVYCGDLYQALPSTLHGAVDLIVANGPYVPTDAIRLMPPEARDHEPPLALDGGSDGLDVHRRVVAGAPRWLAAGGHLLLETSERQAPRTAEFFAEAGFEQRIVHDNDLGATVVTGALVRRSP
jgi:release factor glutamine methyltransferase